MLSLLPCAVGRRRWREGKVTPQESLSLVWSYSRRIWVLPTSKIWSGRRDRLPRDIWKRRIMVRTEIQQKPSFFLCRWNLLWGWGSLYSMPLSLGNIIHTDFFIVTWGPPSSLFPHSTPLATAFFPSRQGKSSLAHGVPEGDVHKYVPDPESLVFMHPLHLCISSL